MHPWRQAKQLWDEDLLLDLWNHEGVPVQLHANAVASRVQLAAFCELVLPAGREVSGHFNHILLS